MIIDTYNLLFGWSYGYSYSIYKSEENEIKQGENYYLSSLSLISQIGIFTTVINDVALRIIAKSSYKNLVAINNTVYYLSIPFCFIASSVKHDNFRGINGKPKLSPSVNRFLIYSAEHLGDLIQVGMILSSVALVALKAYYLGGALLTGMAFHLVKVKGYLPLKVNLFAENYLSTVSDFILLFGNGVPLTNRLASTLSLGNKNPAIAKYIIYKVDSFVKGFLQWFGAKMGPTLADLDAPLVEKKELTYEEIISILNDTNLSLSLDKKSECYLDADTNYEINAAHCSKSVEDDLPTDFAFDKFEDYFHLTNWQEKSLVIQKKFFEDERYLGMLQKDFLKLTNKEKMAFNAQSFPLLHQDNRENIFSKRKPDLLMKEIDAFSKLSDKEKKDVSSQITAFDVQRNLACLTMISLIATKKNLTVEQLLVQQFKEKMLLFVRGIKGEVKVEGSVKIYKMLYKTVRKSFFF